MTVGMIVFTLVLAGFFDAMATIIGVGTEARLADDQGRMPGLSKALFIDGAGGAIGGVTGGSGQTVFIESATGVGEGARTGLASVVTGALFAACLFFTPLTAIVPQEVASAALVVIGAMMLMNARHVDWADRATVHVHHHHRRRRRRHRLHGDQGGAGQVPGGRRLHVGADGRLPRVLRPEPDRELAGRALAVRPGNPSIHPDLP
jgi:hypothetical protein